MLTVVALLSLQAAPPPDVSVRSLIGLSPAAVAAALGAPPPMVEPLVLVEGGRRATVYPGDAFRPLAPAGHRCATQIGDPAGLGGVGMQSVAFRARLVFTDDRLVAVREAPVRETPPAPPRENRRQMIERYVQAGARTDWPVSIGRLPLSDGVGLLDRTTGLTSPDAIVATRCQPAPVPSAAPQQRPFDSAGFLQGLALLPFAVILPALNAERDHDAVAGAALLNSVQPGDVLPGGAEAFVGARPRVRLYRDEADPDYGVIAISVGNKRRNNLSRFNDVGMIGVRGDRVVWEASPAMVEALGLKTAMCVGADGRLDQVRRGCSNTGYFVFGD